MLVGSLVLLVACGSTGEEPRALTDDDYMLDVKAVLDPDHVDAATRVWVVQVDSIENRVFRVGYAQPSHTVGSDGALNMQVDARDLNVDHPPLDPKVFFATYGGGSSLTAADVTVSDSTARLKAVRRLAVFQDNPNGTDAVQSHTLETWFRSNGYSYAGEPVFVERAVTATATWTVGSSNYELDATLEPGWNFVHYIRSGTDFKVTAVPATGAEEFLPWRDISYVASGQVEEIAGVSWFAEHEVQTSSTPTSIHQYFYPSGNARLFVYNWLGFGDGTPVLVPFDQVYPGVLDSTNVSFDPPEAVGLIAAPYGYSTDEVRIEDWHIDPSRAIARIGMGSSDGHNVMMVYADRDVTISFTGPVTDILGSPLVADHVDLRLSYGWNRVEIVDESAGEVWLRVMTESPEHWGLFAR